MGWFKRFSALFSSAETSVTPQQPDPPSPAESVGLKIERTGDMPGAVDAYVREGRPADAARVLILRAETASTAGERLSLLSQAVQLAPHGSEQLRIAQRKYALVRYHHTQQHPELALPTDVAQLATELENLQLYEQAAKLYQQTGDIQGQARTLGALGRIDELDSNLEAQVDEEHEKHQRDVLLSRLHDLNRIGSRRKAIELGQQWLQRHPNDFDVSRLIADIGSSLPPPGPVLLRIGQQTLRLLLGSSFVVGRGDVEVQLRSNALSRRHLKISLGDSGIIVEDLGSHNGTWLAGARLGAPVSLPGPTELRLGNQVPLHIAPDGPDGAIVRIANLAFVARRFSLIVRDTFQLLRDPYDHVVIQALDSSRPPVLENVTADATVELAFGDKIQSEIGGPVLIEVLRP